MGGPAQEQRATGDSSTSDRHSGDKLVRGVTLAVPGQPVPVLIRGDYIDNVFTRLHWNPQLHTYILEFERGGKTRNVEVGADKLGWNPATEHPWQFAGWTSPTQVVDEYYYTEEPTAARANSHNAKVIMAEADKASADETIFAAFYKETPARGGVIVPTAYTSVTAPRLFKALLRMHADTPISEGRRQGWLSVGVAFEAGVRYASVLPAVRGAGLLYRVAAGRVAATASSAAALGRAALLEIRVAVTKYGYSRYAVGYLSVVARNFVVVNAIPVTTAVLLGTDIALNLAGQDTGVFSPADVVEFAVKDVKLGWQLIKAEVISSNRAGGKAMLKVKEVELITAEKAAEQFDSGKLIIQYTPPPHATPTDAPASPLLGARKTDDRSVSAASRATKSDDAAPPAAKVTPNKAAPLKSPVPPPNIHLSELLTEAQVEKLVRQGFKREALEKLRHAQVGELERVGLIRRNRKDYEALSLVETKISRAQAAQQADEVARLQKEQGRILQRIASAGQETVDLYKKLQTSASKGGAVRGFVNEFWDKPGFQDVVLNWAKGGISQQGTNFMMKYSLDKFKNQAVRFEWPVGVSKTRDGGEVPARFVDIVVDGGTKSRPGEALRIEIKKWSEWYLSKDSTRDQIARQLIRDTAFFASTRDAKTGQTRWVFDNVRWVFDSSPFKGKTAEQAAEEVSKVFLRTINEDGYLKMAWGLTEARIKATLKSVIEMYP